MQEQVRESSDAEDFVQFFAAGSNAKGEYQCSDCGYGVAVYRTLPRCPMCGGSSWEESTWSPFSRARATLE